MKEKRIELQKWLAKRIGQKWAYRIVYYGGLIITSAPFFILGLKFDMIEFAFIMFLVNYIRNLTYGFHTTDGRCLIMTYCLFTIFGYLAKTVPLEWSFLIALISGREIYLKAPLQLPHRNKSREWHRDKIRNMLFLYLIVSTVLLFFNLELILSYLLWSLSMVAFTLFENIDRK